MKGKLKFIHLADLGIAVLDFALQRRPKLIHLTVILRGEDFSLLGQPAVKFQPQR
jgi:hypothetical protein